MPEKDLPVTTPESGTFLLDLHAALDSVNAPQMEDYPEPQRAIHRITEFSFALNEEIQRLQRECKAWEKHGQEETFARERLERQKRTVLGTVAPLKAPTGPCPMCGGEIVRLMNGHFLCGNCDLPRGRGSI